MKVLLITNYWYPWNTSGTLRWLQIGRYLDFDVLTSKKPRKAFYDETLPGPNRNSRNVYRHFSSIPAILFGFFIIPFVLAHRYDLYVVTIPPYSLTFVAYILTKLGRKVVVDIRDDFRKNKNNHWGILNPIYGWLQKRIKNKTVVFQFIDKDATRILSGYSPEVDMEYRRYTLYWEFVPCIRQHYEVYNFGLSIGKIPDYRKRIDGIYASSSFVNLLYLGFKNLPVDCLYEECISQPIQSWKETAKQMKEYLEDLQ